MWSCPKCGRIFEKEGQGHSCHVIALSEHFKNKEKAKEVFDYFVEQVNKTVGTCKIISLPCCIHLFGKYDFLAVLSKKEGLEIRFALDRKIDSPRLKICVPMSLKVFKNCFEIKSKEEVNAEFLGWVKEAYRLRD
jgi:hypothetical protein